MQVIDEVATVSRSMRRQVPIIHEMQKDQKPEEVQISFKEYVDHAKDGQNDMSCMKGAPHLVLTSKAGRTKPKCRKTRTSDGGAKESNQAPPDVWTGRSMRTHRAELRSAR